LRHTDSAGRPRPDARAGFALIEMLAGLTIAVAIVAVLAQFTSQALRNWNRGESTIAVMEMLTSGLGRLRTDLAAALPMRTPGTDNPSVIFAGDAQQLMFVAATGFGAGDRGLELISVTVTKEQEDTLVVRQRGQVATGPTPLRDPVVLLRGRMQVRFTYQDDLGQTLEIWSNRDRLPKAVAVNILNAAGTSVFPAPVVLKLPTTMAAACISGASSDDGTGMGMIGCPGQQQVQRDQQRRRQQNPLEQQ
jgi:type II secretory pathway component PulJ